MGKYNKNEDEIINLSSVLVEGYLKLHQTPVRSDLIVALGSGVKQTALYVADLYQNDLAPRVLLAGYGPDRQKEHLPESLNYRDMVVNNGVPKENIIIEKESTNTLQNAKYSRLTLEKLSLIPKTALLVTTPFHERRALATFQKQWPEVQLRITSPNMDIASYAKHNKLSSKLIGTKIIHEIENIQKYGEKGDITVQPFPIELSNTYQKLYQLILS